MILVKIGKSGGRVQEYAVQEGAKVRDVMTMYGINKSGDLSIIFNGAERTSEITEYLLKNGDVIMLTEAKKLLNIRFARIGDSIQHAQAREGMTVRTILHNVGLSPAANEDVWVHHDGIPKGEIIGLDECPVDGAILVIEPRKQTLADKVCSVIKRHTGQSNHNSSFVTELIDVVKRG